MKWALLGLALVLPASAERPRIAVLPFAGKAAQGRSQLAAALCKQAQCVPPDSVLNPEHSPDWAKIAINGVVGVVSGRLVKSHHKQEWELSVLVSAQQPSWTTTVPAEKLSTKAQSKLVKEILQHVLRAEGGELPTAPAPLREEAAPPPQPAHEEPVATGPPPPSAAPEPVPGETPEERAARAAAADQAFAAGGKKKKKDETAKVAVAPKAEPEPLAAKPKPAPKSREPEPEPPPSTSHGNYKPLPPELLSFTPRI
jgi:hypothetical protein